ncbi:HTH-type transcriptional regulator YdcR [Mycobacteroides abscessus subsp. abscessus]|nr:HTH-type transcriptional regulator YdcR [Mycobacteroides abscessus subsp. abscessus]
MDTGTPILEQLAAAELLERAEEVEAAQRETLRARRALVVSELHRRLPEWELQEADGGLCIWARLPAPMSTAGLAHRYRRSPPCRFDDGGLTSAHRAASTARRTASTARRTASTARRTASMPKCA